MATAARVKLTQNQSLSLKPTPGQAQAIYWDTDLRGFGVRISPKGKAVYFVQYRDKLGKQAKHTIGDVKVLKAEVARDRAKAAMSQVQLGGNPQQALRERKQGDRVIDVVNAYLERAKTTLKPKSYVEVERAVMRVLKPLHHQKVDTITRSQVANLLDKVAKDSGPYAANRARAYMSAMWTWALRQGRATNGNPVAYTPSALGEAPRDRVLADHELALIWRSTDTGHDHDRIVRLLLLTAARREEVGSMAWDEVGGAGCDGVAVWTLPADRSKNGLPHEVALGALAQAQLPEKRKGVAPVFGRALEGSTGFSGWSKCKERLDAHMLATLEADFVKAHRRKPKAGEVKLAGWRLHDLRRTFSTWANEAGIEPHVVEAVLNHISGASKRGVAGVYNRATYRAQKAAALATWEAHIRRITEAETI